LPPSAVAFGKKKGERGRNGVPTIKIPQKAPQPELEGPAAVQGEATMMAVHPFLCTFLIRSSSQHTESLEFWGQVLLPILAFTSCVQTTLGTHVHVIITEVSWSFLVSYLWFLWGKHSVCRHNLFIVCSLCKTV
jgi:hypothetical protein